MHFIAQAYRDPARLPLVEPDARDYIWHNPSGYGIRDGAAWLYDYAEEMPGVTVICVDYITCERLSILEYLPERITTASTDILSPAWLVAEREAGRDVLLGQDDPPQVMAFDPGSEYRLEEAGRWERPSGQTAFTLYRILPVR
ncbi:MAG: hypothetical protein IT326_01570, partial [Anaerolineae bacterium]|nr:hypothetical protein [Anaerolineae bacterium]